MSSEGEPGVKDFVTDVGAVSKDAAVNSATGVVNVGKAVVSKTAGFLAETAKAGMGVNAYGTNVDGTIDARELAQATKDATVTTAQVQ